MDGNKFNKIIDKNEYVEKKFDVDVLKNNIYWEDWKQT
jgi:hypothetical protein